MKILDSFTDREGNFHHNECVCDIEIISDTAEHLPWEYTRRRIKGRIIRYGDLWKPFLDTWIRPAKPYLVDESNDNQEYFWTNGITINRDYYAFNVGVNFDDSHLYLLVGERYSGTPEEYYEIVNKRNEEARKFDNPTGNDLRDAMNLPRLKYPHLEKPVTEKILLDCWQLESKRYNCIV